MRSFLNGKMDLSQAEAVADLIASDAAGAHQLAIQQLRGGFSNEIKAMREELIQFAALIELELDFSEEDVEFANREQLLNSVSSLQDKLNRLISSFEWGNVMKSGVPVVIAGKPNAGKSTLLNALLNEERAIVSDIAGTTRDTIEEVLTLDGIKFRFVDTAGLRRTDDTIEKIGVERTWEKIRQSPVILYLFDVNTTTTAGLEQELEDLKPNLPDGYHLILLGNKSDGISANAWKDKFNHTSDWLRISAKERTGLDELQKQLVAFVTQGKLESGETVVTNARHVAALRQTHHSLQQVSAGLSAGLTHDLIAGELRYALYHLGLITGTISNEDLLDTIFSKFCIGK
jgi:tRNA modification GTPase